MQHLTSWCAGNQVWRTGIISPMSEKWEVRSLHVALYRHRLPICGVFLGHERKIHCTFVKNTLTISIVLDYPRDISGLFYSTCWNVFEVCKKNLMEDASICCLVHRKTKSFKCLLFHLASLDVGVKFVYWVHSSFCCIIFIWSLQPSSVHLVNCSGCSDAVPVLSDFYDAVMTCAVVMGF